MDKFIQRPLTRSEVDDILKYLSYHLSYTPTNKLRVIFTKTPKQFAKLHGAEPDLDLITEDQINQGRPSGFFDHLTNTVVFQGFSYVEGITVSQFVIPMADVIHEIIHFYQYSTGTFGKWQTLYEGTNEILSCFFTDDYSFDYKDEAVYVFNLAMILSNNDFWEAINWMKRYTTHSDKDGFVSRSILQCETLSKYRPSNLMRWLDNKDLQKIKNVEVRNLFTKYSESKIKKLLHKNRQLIS
jgi:hypothetical protein